VRAGDLGHLRVVSVADVYKSGVRAGQLARRADGVEFRYERAYLERGGPPVATTLPLSEEPFRTFAGAVPPFFAGLLPEGRRLTWLRRAVKTSADDELSLLLAVGRDTVGDVQVVPSGEAVTAAEPLLQVQRDWSEVRFSEVLADAGIVDPVGLPGVQDKVSARMIAVPLGRAGARYLLKIDPPEFPHVVANEAFFLRLAREIGIRSASATVVTDADGRPGLLVERFDRIAGASGTTLPLACEDACQVLGRWPADKYNVTTEEVIVGLAEHCAARVVALRELFRQVCFAWLTGNGDVHAKNLSILATPDGEWRVAPAYDVPSTVPYGDTTLALSIGGRTSGLSRRHLLALASTIGLPGRAALKALDAIVERLGDLEGRLRDGSLPFSTNAIDDLVAELRYRRRLATGEI
jgi:serine/threonine-protein kinase HipA